VPLYVVATPIGNLADLSPRAMQVLSEAAVVLCEDTRHTRKLFSSVGRPAPEMWSCNAHNELEKLPGILELLERDLDLALVSDAGTPGISDPGGRLVEAVHRAGHAVHVVPGPSSVVSALSVSGFPASPFHFMGFPPRKAGALRLFLLRALGYENTVVILESGKRAERLMAQLSELAPEREVVICRELSKRYEEIHRAPLSELEAAPIRGEMVVVVGPGEAPTLPTVETELGTGLKAIAAVLAERWNCSKRDAYQRLLDLENS
jgi:16S rRNA (cytidine1402-2'-O)-methyltransferase